MGVHPKVFPDHMHTSVSNLVQHGKFHWEESVKKRKTNILQHNISIWEIVLGLRSVHMSSLRCLHRNQNLFYILSRVRIAPPKSNEKEKLEILTS